MSQEELRREFDDLAKKLTDPECLSNPLEYQKIARRYGEIKVLLAKAVSATDEDEAIIEIRAGAGGNESSLFA